MDCTTPRQAELLLEAYGEFSDWHWQLLSLKIGHFRSMWYLLTDFEGEQQRLGKCARYIVFTLEITSPFTEYFDSGSGWVWLMLLGSVMTGVYRVGRGVGGRGVTIWDRCALVGNVRTMWGGDVRWEIGRRKEFVSSLDGKSHKFMPRNVKNCWLRVDN